MPAAPRVLEIPESLNIADWVVDRHVRAGLGDRVAAWTSSGRRTYAELRDVSNRFANLLVSLGVRRGDSVLLRLGNGMPCLAALLGAMKVGAVAVPTNFLLGEHELAAILDNSDAVLAISTPELAGPLEAARSHAGCLRQVLLVGGDGETSLERRLEGASPDFVAADTRATDPAFILYSSGTTGRPKGVQHAHRWIVAGSDGVCEAMLGLRKDDVCFSPMDWSFAYPLGCGLLFPLSRAASMVVAEGRFDAETAFATIERCGVTVMAAVPTIYRMMLLVADAERRYRVGSLRAGVSGGEATPADTVNQWQRRFGVKICDAIGQTESFIFIANRIDMEIRPGSMGKPLPGWDVAVLDDEGRLQPSGEIGHLVIRNDHPGLTVGYRKDAERWAAVNRGGWYYTGDLAYADDDGYYWYVSRADDLIKSRGYLISPKEIESVLMEHPAVLEAAVVGVRDEVIAQRIKAFVVPKAGTERCDALAEGLRAHARARIAPFKVPADVEFCDALPKGLTGKVLRRVLRAESGAIS